MSSAELEAVVRLRPMDQKIRLRKVPSKAKPPSHRKCRTDTDQSFSPLMKNGIRTTVEMTVRMAEKLTGETSRRAILAKG